MGWIKRKVEAVAIETVKAHMPAMIDRVMGEILGLDLPNDAALDERQFTMRIGRHFCRRGMSGREALALAHPTLCEMLADNKITFGDAAYIWNDSSARVIAQEYQIDFWEATT